MRGLLRYFMSFEDITVIKAEFLAVVVLYLEA